LNPFITTFTSARHLSLSWARSIQSMPPPPSHNLKIRHIIILPSTSGSSKWFFPSCFRTKILYAPLLYPYVQCARPLHSSPFDHPNNIWWGVQIIQLRTFITVDTEVHYNLDGSRPHRILSLVSYFCDEFPASLYSFACVCVEVLMHEADSVRATDWTTYELGFDPCSGNWISTFPNRPDLLWHPPGLLFNRCRWLLTRGNDAAESWMWPPTYLVPRLKMVRAVPSLPHMPSKFGA